MAKGIQALVRAKPALILIASTTAPAGPEDVVGRALAASGGQIERFLAPVEPGNLMMLSYREDVPIVSAPGCFRSAKPNVVDLILPPLMARYRVSDLGDSVPGARRSTRLERLDAATLATAG